jgi:hypothetical protein
MAPPPDGLDGLLAQHKRFLTEVHACILTDVSATHDDQYKNFILVLSHRIEVHQKRLQVVTQNEHGTDDAVQWGPIKATRISRDGAGKVFNIHGPATGDMHVVKVDDEESASKLASYWPSSSPSLCLWELTPFFPNQTN